MLISRLLYIYIIYVNKLIFIIYFNNLFKGNYLPCLDKYNEKTTNEKTIKEKKHEKGQYFTTNTFLKENVYKLIKNNPSIILEPSIGQGDLIDYIKKKKSKI